MLDLLGEGRVPGKRMEHSSFPRLWTSGPTELSDKIGSGRGVPRVVEALPRTRPPGDQLACLGGGGGGGSSHVTGMRSDVDGSGHETIVFGRRTDLWTYKKTAGLQDNARHLQL